MYLRLNGKKISILIAQNTRERFLGLMGQRHFQHGMLFCKCNAIHTFFMKENIDVIGLNERNEVIFLYENLPKNRIIRVFNPVKKTCILELPAHASHTISLGSILFFESEDII